MYILECNIFLILKYAILYYLLLNNKKYKIYSALQSVFERTIDHVLIN